MNRISFKSIIPASYANLTVEDKLEIALCYLESAQEYLFDDLLDAEGISYESKDLAVNIDKFLYAIEEGN